MATQFSIKDGKRWKVPFFTIWSGQALSLLGSQLVQFALIWYLTVQTGSATVLATASLVGLIPHVVLGPIVGTLVDRWNRRLIMILADSAIALATVGLVVLFAMGVAEIWHIYGLVSQLTPQPVLALPTPALPAQPAQTAEPVLSVTTPNSERFS